MEPVPGRTNSPVPLGGRPPPASSRERSTIREASAPDSVTSTWYCRLSSSAAFLASSKAAFRAATTASTCFCAASAIISLACTAASAKAAASRRASASLRAAVIRDRALSSSARSAVSSASTALPALPTLCRKARRSASWFGRLDDLELTSGPVLGEDRHVEVGLGLRVDLPGRLQRLAGVVEGLLGDDQVGLGLGQVLRRLDEGGGVVRLLGGPPLLLLGLLARLLGRLLALLGGPLARPGVGAVLAALLGLGQRLRRARGGGGVGRRSGQPGTDQGEADGGEQGSGQRGAPPHGGTHPPTPLARSPAGLMPRPCRGLAQARVSPHVVPLDRRPMVTAELALVQVFTGKTRTQ